MSAAQILQNQVVAATLPRGAFWELWKLKMHMVEFEPIQGCRGIQRVSQWK